MSELENARRTIAKAEEALLACERYFAKQAEMNAQSHMAERVMYPPIHGVCFTAIQGILSFHDTYPDAKFKETE